MDLLGGSPSTEKNSRLIDIRNPGRLFMYQLQAREAKPFPGPSYFPGENETQKKKFGINRMKVENCSVRVIVH